jgi:5-methylcytosine-specific restriction endonuclease McrA
MPSSPSTICRMCNSRATHDGYCERHSGSKNDSKRSYDRFRADDPIRALYRGKNAKRWQRVRQQVLRRDVLCKSCGHEAATVVDHILVARLVVDNYGVDEFYNPDRLQGLCKTCHDIKTTHESGWTGRKGTQLTDLGDRSNTTVVCGQSGSGKSTYVERFKRPNDLVWDYDVIMAEITGLPLHQGLPGAIGSVLANRDQWIEATRYSTNHCWLIVSNPQAVIVEMMRDAGATIVVMDTPDDECQRRLKQRFIAETMQQHQ